MMPVTSKRQRQSDRSLFLVTKTSKDKRPVEIDSGRTSMVFDSVFCVFPQTIETQTVFGRLDQIQQFSAAFDPLGRFNLHLENGVLNSQSIVTAQLSNLT